MELLRSLLLEQLLVHPNYPEEGGNLEAEIGHIKRPQKKGEMTMIMTAFDKHEKLERECIERYKLPTQVRGDDGGGRPTLRLRFNPPRTSS